MKCQKPLSLILSIVLALSLVPVHVLAEEDSDDNLESRGMLSEDADALHDSDDAALADDEEDTSDVEKDGDGTASSDTGEASDPEDTPPLSDGEATTDDNEEIADPLEEPIEEGLAEDTPVSNDGEADADGLGLGVVLETQASGASTKSAMYSGYKAILEQARSGQGVFATTYKNCNAGRSVRENSNWLNDLEYSLFDINADGTPELLVRNGTIAAYTNVECFTFRNGGVIHMGRLGDCLWYANAKGELYGAYMKMGASTVYIITASSTTVNTTKVFEYIKNDDTSYSRPRAFLKDKGANAIDKSNAFDFALLWKVITSLTISFVDVSANTPHAEDILWLSEMGISTGWVMPDGTRQFRPTNTVIRQDMAAFLFRVARGWGIVGDSWRPTGKVTFTDVTPSTPHYREIMWLAESGVSAGWTMPDGTRQFRPTNTVVRQDMAAFLRRMQALRDPSVARWKPSGASPFTDVNSNTPHHEDVLWLAESGVSAGWSMPGGTRQFRPTNTVVRQDMAAFLHRLDSLG